ncbi:hypothetical protein Ccr5_gp167c [Caulobacter phage Ccr5]|nr:hypothetical protein Ccr5_gp167c [Caulobacter phage Ccr5]
MFYWLVGLFLAIGWWVAGATIVPTFVREMGVRTLDEFGIYGWFVFITGLALGALWPASLFALFWIPVFWLLRKKLNAGAQKMIEASEK